MKTKAVDFFVDLYPGWQDVPGIYLCASTLFGARSELGYRRIRITAELPCFGGSEDYDGAVQGSAVEVPRAPRPLILDESAVVRIEPVPLPPGELDPRD